MNTLSMRSPDARKFSDDDCTQLRNAIDAVCAELGLEGETAPRRALIEARMRDAFIRGPRNNLNLVDAGFRAF